MAGKTLELKIEDFWPDEESIGEAIERRITSHINQKHRETIAAAVTKAVDDAVQARMDEEIAAMIQKEVRAVLDSGIVVSDKWSEPPERISIREYVVGKLRSMIDGRNERGYSGKLTHHDGLIEKIIQKECESVLKTETAKAIKEINADVLKRARETVAETVAAKMFNPSDIARLGS